MTTWVPTTLGKVLADKGYIRGPFGSALKRDEMKKSGIPVYEQKNAIYGDRDFRFYIGDEKFEELKRFQVKTNDLIISCSGTVGKISIINEEDPKGIISQALLILRADINKVTLRYLYYLLSSSQGFELLTQASHGSVQVNIAERKVVEQIPLLLPTVQEQKAIAAVLSSLDDKIDLLHRQNKTLEAMAEALFRQWFVEEAQEDWEEAVLDDVITVKGGTTPSTKEPEYWDGTIHWTTPRDLSNHNSIFLFDTERKITEKGLSQIGSGLIPVGSVLLSSRAPIGYLAIADIPAAINQGYIAIVCDKLVSNYFIYLWCKANMEAIKNAGNGSTFEEISKSNFKALEVVIPPTGKLKEFDDVVSPSFEKIRTNKMQIRTLEKLRDTLLPKLMSGEVRVAA